MIVLRFRTLADLINWYYDPDNINVMEAYREYESKDVARWM